MLTFHITFVSSKILITVQLLKLVHMPKYGSILLNAHNTANFRPILIKLYTRLFEFTCILYWLRGPGGGGVFIKILSKLTL